jgi:PAS domain S-box-containing protein
LTISVGLANHTILISKGGTEIPIDDSAAPIKDEDGKTAGVVLIFRDITERKHAEHLLHRNRIDLERSQEVGQIGSWRLDIKRDVLTWSDENYRMFGVPKGTPLTYEVFLAIVHPDDRRSVDTQWNAGLAGEPYDIEHRIVVNGQTKWVREKAYMEFDDAGELLGGFGITQDITERKQAEENTKHLASFPSLNPNPVLEVDLSGAIAFCNAAAQKVLEDEEMDKGECKFFCPTDLAAILRDWDKTSELTVGREIAIKNRVFGVTVQLVPRFGVARIYAQEITKRKRAEEALLRARDELELRVQKRTAQLRESEKMALDRMREIETYYHMAPIGLCILDTDLHYLRINELLAGWNGMPASEHVGRALREVIPRLADQAERIARQVIETGKPVTNVEMTGESLDQSSIRKTWLTGWHPRKDSAGSVVGISVAVQEITQQRDLENQLRQSQKMEAIGTLAGGIAHDFNNMLAAILGFTEMALEDVADRPDVKRNLQNVSKAAMRARDLVKQILTFSRKTTHERNPLPLLPLINETVQLLRASIPATIEIKFTATATSDRILAAPIEIQQILMNLATNASLAMQEKGGTLDVSLTDINFEPDSPVFGANVSPGEYVQLVVKDTGTGMSPGVMKRVFEPFFTTREAGRGTGMGLSVVYGIVKDLQGTITVESELGVGSTFSVLLPKVKTDVQTEVVRPVGIPGGNEGILFVDDEEMLVEWGRVTLERLGYKVTAMTDSREALKAFSNDPSLFDLVITDHAMPQIAGAQLAKKLVNVREDIPIILCTGHSDTISSESAGEIGVREFLTKPVSKQELADAVRRALDGKG